MWMIPGFTNSDWWTREVGQTACTFEEMALIVSSTNFIGLAGGVESNLDVSSINFSGVVSFNWTK